MRALDQLRSGRGYGNRSEFVRDLLRGELVKEEWADQAGETVGVLVLVYGHDRRALADKLTDIQHERHGVITAATCTSTPTPASGRFPCGPGSRGPEHRQPAPVDQGGALRPDHRRQAPELERARRFR